MPENVTRRRRRSNSSDIAESDSVKRAKVKLTKRTAQERNTGGDEEREGNSGQLEHTLGSGPINTNPMQFLAHETDAFKRIKVRGETEVSSFVKGSNELSYNSVINREITQKNVQNSENIVFLKSAPPKPKHPLPLIIKANGGGYGTLNIFKDSQGNNMIITAAHVVKGTKIPEPPSDYKDVIKAFLENKPYVKEVESIELDLDKDIVIVKVTTPEDSPSWPISTHRTLTEEEKAILNGEARQAEVPQFTVSTPFEDIPFKPVSWSKRKYNPVSDIGQVKYGYIKPEQKTQGGESGSSILDAEGNIVGVHNLSGSGILFL